MNRYFNEMEKEVEANWGRVRQYFHRLECHAGRFTTNDLIAASSLS